MDNLTTTQATSRAKLPKCAKIIHEENNFEHKQISEIRFRIKKMRRQVLKYALENNKRNNVTEPSRKN